MVKTLSGVTNFSVANNLKVNKLTANASTGTAGQILTSNGSAPYWNDLSVTVNAGDGLTGGGSGTDLTLNVGAGDGITVAADSISVNAAYINTIAANSSTYLGGNTAQDLRDYSSNATNLSSGTVAEARLPFRMDQNVRTTDNVQFGNITITGNLVVNGTSTVLQGNVVTFTDNMLYLNQGISATITNITSNGTHVIFTANNNYSAGWDVDVTGVDPSSYNGTYNNIFAANATTFTVANTNTASYVSGGTARGKTDVNPDIGLSAGYNDGTYAHTGFFRDASDGVWKVFDSYLPEPDESVFIDTANASFKIANFQANTIYVGNTSVYATINTTSFTGTANNATYFNGYTWAAPAALGGSTANSGSFTTVTTSGNVGIKNSAPTDTLSVNGTSYFGANVTITSALIANSGAGSAGQALFSNGSGTYWASPTDNNTTYDLLAVANTEQNKGIVRLRSSSNANDDVYVVGGGGVVVSSNDTTILVTGEFGDITGVNAGNGLTGTAVSGDVTLSVLANTGIVANATGVYVNAAYIATIDSNTANFVSNGTTTNTFTVGTASYFVANGNLGIGTNAPATKLHVTGDVITGKLQHSPVPISRLLTAFDAADSDFLSRVTLSGDASVLAVGAPGWEGATGNNRGSVYIYDWNGSNWVQRGSVLEAADAADTDNFGIHVSLNNDGSILVVGASTWEGATGSNRGGVYIYDWNGSDWVQRGSVLEASDAADTDNFGTSFSLSSNGSVLAVGANGWEGATGNNRGGVYIYDWNGSSWVQRGSVLEASDAADTDQFGAAVALSGDASILAVGAFQWEGATGNNRGGVYIYDWNGSSWVQRGSVLEAADAADADFFGADVSLSSNGSVLAVAAASWEGDTGTGRGSIYIYDWNGSSWIQRGSVLEASDAADNDTFGTRISLNDDGSILVVGASGWEGDAGSSRGSVYTYSLTGALPSYSGVATGSGWIEGANSALIARTAGLDRITIESSGNVVISNTSDLVFSTNAGIYANGSLGTAGQILTSDGTTVYWTTAADNNTTYDLAAVANVAVNEGLVRLTSSSNANDDVKVSGANGIVVSSNATHVILTNQIIAGSGLTGATANTVAVVGNTGIVANATGVFVNASYIATIASNTASFANASSTNTFTVGTASYFVSSGSVGIGTNAPTVGDVTGAPALSVRGTNARINIGTNDVDMANGVIGTISFVAEDPRAASAVHRNLALIRGIYTGGNSTLDTDLVFYTATAGSAENERLRILGNGNIGIGNSAPTTKLSVNGTTYLQANVTINSALISNGDAGSAGQVLTSNGTATYWGTVSAGVNTAEQYAWTNVHTFSANVSIPKLVANSSLGGTGQILFSDGANTYWGTAPTGGIAPVTNIVTGTSVSAAKDNRYFLTNTAPTTVTLPATPTLGDTVYIVVTNSLANNVVARNGSKIMSLDEDLTLDISYYSIGLTYLDTTRGWIIV